MAKLAGDHCVVICDDTGGSTQNISTGIQTVNIVADTDQHEVTGMEAVHNFLPGQHVRAVTLTGLVNPASNKTHDVLSKRAGSAGTLTVQIGANTAPTTGDPEFEGEMLLSSYVLSAPNNAPVTFTANFVQSGSTACAWSTVS